jgi:hypothetical protein
MNTKNIVGVLLLLCIAAVIGSSVDQERITTFEAGTPAVASEINENYQALIDAINNNAARLALLEQGVPSRSLENEVTGATYKLMVAPTMVGGAASQATPGSLWTAHGIVTEEVTLNADGTLDSDGSNMMFLPFRDLENVGSPTVMTTETDTYDDSGTWSIDGSSIVVDFGDQAISFQMSADASMGFTTIAEPYDPEPGSAGATQGPSDAHLVALAVMVRTVIPPQIDSIFASGLTVEVRLANEGSGGALSFARALLTGPTPPDLPTTGWQSSDTFPLETGVGTYYYWARRGSVAGDPVPDIAR